MRYKGILLDIDNTLYNYTISHSLAKSRVIDFCVDKFGLSKIEIISAYSEARNKVHIELSQTAACHNRLLYFQRMLEILNVNALKYSFEIYNVYWDNFLNALKPFDGVYDLLEMYENRICLLTDLTAHIQYRKIQKLHLDKYCNKIVTSEEAGCEKPHPFMFMSGLYKLNLRANEVCMIGDSFKKDILGANSLGIQSIWFNHENNKENFDSDIIKEVRSFNEIARLL